LKHIDCWDDLRPCGIVPLTREACGLSYRLLCDLTAKGKKIIEKMFGVRELGAAENWNRGTEENPHIGSMLLANEMFVPVAVFALLESGCTEVWTVHQRHVVGFEPSDSAAAIEHFKQFNSEYLGRRFGYFGTVGDRNVHEMTGRVT
jgi:hypothetical protein